MWTVLLDSSAETELATMPSDIQARFIHISEMLQEFRPQSVGLPHIRFLQDKLWEMRMKSRDGIARAIYVAQTGKQLVVLHVFIKKTEKTPRRALKTATERLRKINNE